MQPQTPPAYVAFVGSKRIGAGDLEQVALAVKAVLDAGNDRMPIIFEGPTGRAIDLDLSGTAEDVVARLASHPAAGESLTEGLPAGGARRGPGRPRLGVVAREVTLLPRHWEWLSEQPGGASVTLRKLVEQAKRSTAGEVKVRQAREACYRFMTAVAGDEPGFEEAIRALFAGNRDRFQREIREWPPDVRDHVLLLAGPAFLSVPESEAGG